MFFFCFCKQKTAYEMRISDWSSDVCSSDLLWAAPRWREEGVAIEQHWSARDAGDGWRFPVEAPPPPRRGARRFDAGELDEPLPLAMAAAGLEQVLAWGVPGIAAALGERTPAPDDEIGSASCRDSVCQHVSISALPVSLQTKIKTQDEKQQHTVNTTSHNR